jgi:hypothetical protein
VRATGILSGEWCEQGCSRPADKMSALQWF